MTAIFLFGFAWANYELDLHLMRIIPKEPLIISYITWGKPLSIMKIVKQ
jgi:hypothetical protein